jgi:hypothetical protein
VLIDLGLSRGCEQEVFDLGGPCGWGGNSSPRSALPGLAASVLLDISHGSQALINMIHGIPYGMNIDHSHAAIFKKYDNSFSIARSHLSVAHS